MKYIVFIVDEETRQVPNIFDDTIDHVCQARGMCHAYGRSNISKHAQPISAGFCYKEEKTGAWVAHGNSESLNLESRPEDSALLNKYYNRKRGE